MTNSRSTVSCTTLTLCLALTLTSCMRMGRGTFGDKISTTSGSRIDGSSPAPTQTTGLTITDEKGQPIAGAQVMIGQRENVPFPGNLLKTDAFGQLPIPQGWTDAQPVTIEAPGFVRATYFGRLPGPASLPLTRRPAKQPFELKGEATNFGKLTKDGFLDVGFVFPAFSRAKAVTVQLASLVSKQMDQISVIGQTQDVPSNMTFPLQKETYVFPVTFNKPIYRFYLDTPGTWKFAAAHVRFPFKPVADELRDGKSILDVINMMEFRQASVRDISISTSSTTANIPVNEIALSPQLTVKAPNFDPKLAMFALSLSENQGLYYVTDAKRLEPKQTHKLSSPKTNMNGFVVRALKRTTETIGAISDDMSAMLGPASQSAEPFEMLPLIKAPEVRSQNLVLDPPRAIPGIEPLVTYAVLSKVEVIDNGSMKLENKSAEWELYAENWSSTLALPELPSAHPRPSGSHRWEVLFGGGSSGTSSSGAGPDTLEKVSHVTRSAVDF